MGSGKQSFALTRDGQNVLSETSLKDISDKCPCGIYNFNAYVGTIPAAPPPSDTLQPEGLEKFTVSMSAQCKPTPSLGAAGRAFSAAKSNAGSSKFRARNLKGLQMI